MRRRLLFAVAAAIATVAVAVPSAVALPDPTDPPNPGDPGVSIDNRGGCYYVVVKGKSLPQNGICYLGPPPPS